MFVRWCSSLVAVSALSACAAAVESDAPDDRREVLAAPFVLELGDDQRVQIPGALLGDGREGLVTLHGGVVEASRGNASIDGDDTTIVDGPRVEVRWRDGRRTTSLARALGLHSSAAIVLEDVELAGFDRATFTGDDGEVELDEPLHVLEAPWLSWSGDMLIVEALPDAERGPSSSSSSSAVRSGGRGRTPRSMPDEVTAPIDPTAHAGDLPPVGPDDLVPELDALAGPGDVCQSSMQCDASTRCVANPIDSDGAFRCLAECVPPVDGTAPTGFTPSDNASCVDDDGCCDPTAVCRNGACEPEDAGDGGDDGTVAPSSSAGGCDPDGDDVISACDAHPNESCKADADGDGCNDSFDKDDSDSNNCSIRVARPNSLAWMMLVLIFARGRPRRR